MTNSTNSKYEKGSNEATYFSDIKGKLKWEIFKEINIYLKNIEVESSFKKHLTKSSIQDVENQYNYIETLIKAYINFLISDFTPDRLFNIYISIEKKLAKNIDYLSNLVEIENYDILEMFNIFYYTVLLENSSHTSPHYYFGKMDPDFGIQATRKKQENQKPVYSTKKTSKNLLKETNIMLEKLKENYIGKAI